MPGPSNAAENLVLRFTERGHSHDMSFPAGCVRFLSKVVPDEVLEIFNQAGVNIDELEARFRSASNLTQGPVIALADPDTDRSLFVFLR